ncbi:MAG: hypothetical protein HYX87_05290 [Chloroflexi bacterium]|nr:hypothetical protein [Chloroflexota bacterium]
MTKVLRYALMHLIIFSRKAHWSSPASRYVTNSMMPDVPALSSYLAVFHTPFSPAEGETPEELPEPGGGHTTWWRQKPLEMTRDDKGMFYRRIWPR